MAKINITVNDDLLKKIDDFADENYTTRSGFFAQAANQFLLEKSVPKSLQDIAVCFKRIADNNQIDEESKKQLEEFAILSKMLSQTQ